MFKFIQSTPESRDCTCGYKIELDKEYTVRTFVDTVLKERNKEWGYIGIYNQESFFGGHNCEYRYGKIITDPLDDSVLDKTIVEVTASGGWSRMDYVIKCN